MVWQLRWPWGNSILGFSGVRTSFETILRHWGPKPPFVSYELGKLADLAALPVSGFKFERLSFYPDLRFRDSAPLNSKPSTLNPEGNPIKSGSPGSSRFTSLPRNSTEPLNRLLFSRLPTAPKRVPAFLGDDLDFWL